MQANWGGYNFDVYKMYEGTWFDVGGVYIFSALNANNLWYPFYIGKAQSFANRFANHERWVEAVRLGATHVHAMVVQQEGSRQLIEAALIEAYQPSMNSLLK